MLKGISDYVNSATSNLRREAVEKSDEEDNNIVIEDGYQETGKEGDDLSMTGLAKTAAAGAGLGIGIANSGEIKKLSKRIDELEAQKQSTSPTAPEPALTKKELKALNWVRKKVFFDKVKSMDFDYGLLYSFLGGFPLSLATGLCSITFPEGLAIFLTPAVLSQVGRGVGAAKEASKYSVSILQKYSEKESLPKVAESYGKYIKTDRDRELFYGE